MAPSCESNDGCWGRIELANDLERGLDGLGPKIPVEEGVESRIPGDMPEDSVDNAESGQTEAQSSYQTLAFPSPQL